MIADLDTSLMLAAMTVAMIAGLIKGIVGFAMPMVMISGLSGFVPAELALAGLIMPTLVTNGMQALAQGRDMAWRSIKRFRRFLLFGLVMLLFSAQLVPFIPERLFLILLGAPVTLFALVWLSGRELRLPDQPTATTEASIGSLAGFIGGLSGIWGPPTVMYLTSMGTEKREQMRVQGVIYGLGAAALFFAHLGSGILDADSIMFSALLIPAAVLGMWLGGRMQSQIDQRMFRYATLVVLLVAGLNLVRRGLLG